jgi:hypothetical protein
MVNEEKYFINNSLFTIHNSQLLRFLQNLARFGLDKIPLTGLVN